ncbi:putative heavy metal transport (copper)/detoxification protein [Flavobacterium limnosediminis JC2902]|uniref:Putative heavy metal transport (Copper)/detoxification protein n=1 Tax=Flavobacterium limnosediminis JC2902 TaxID=1341181 RepID=V6SK97_9FLAO|nr:putative heavy metal transport (copper)/detoxification protein [Flavobacterium limnosediminis JC2902]
MKLLNQILMGIIMIFSLGSMEAQVKNTKTETVKVYGNCGMC